MTLEPQRIVLAAIAVFVGCSQAGRQTEAKFPADPAYEHPATPAADPQKELERVKAACEREARTKAPGEVALPFPDLIFVGRVTAVGKSPGVGSGVVVVTQPVAFDVREQIRGRFGFLEKHPSLCTHAIVLGAPAGSADRTPRIDPALYRVGAELVVAVRLETAPGDWGSSYRFVEGSWCGLPSLATPAILEEIRRAAAR